MAQTNAIRGNNIKEVFQYKNLKEELDEARKLECLSPK